MTRRWLSVLWYFGLARPLARRRSRVSMYSTMAWLSERDSSKHEYAGRYMLMQRNGKFYSVELWSPWEWV